MMTVRSASGLPAQGCAKSERQRSQLKRNTLGGRAWRDMRR